MYPAPDFPLWRRVTGAVRTVLRNGGGTCSVYEMTAGQGYGSSRVLVFNEPARVRRVRDYPAAWERLSDAELLALADLL